MNSISNWIVSTSGVPAVPVMWLAVKLTVVLAVTWLLHAAAGQSNPRWRVLLWRTSVIGTLSLVALALRPPFLIWSLLPPSHPEDQPLRIERAREAASLDAQQVVSAAASGFESPPVPGTISGLAGDQATSSRTSPRDSHAGPLTSARTASSAADTSSQGRADSERSTLPRSGMANRTFSNHRRIIATWCGGVLVGMAWTTIGLVRLARIRRRATTVPPWLVSQADQVARGLGLEGPCEIRWTRDLHSPCLIGLWSPMILLPEQQFEAEPREELSSIFAHELAHVRGNDLAWNALFHGLSIVLWFHPLVWRIRITHVDACDAVCDAIAADYIGDANRYGRTLARLALRLTGPEVSVGLSMARKSCTLRRIEALQRHEFRARLPRLRTTCLVVVAAMATILLGGLGLGRSNAGPTQPAEVALGPVVPETSRVEEPQAVARQPGVLTGEVVEAETETPVAGADVLLRDTVLHRATTDEKGRFRFADLPKGQYRIWAFKEGLASPKERLIGRESPPPGGVQFTPIRLTMSPGKQLKLTVASAGTGRPIEGADVRLGYPDRRRVTTDQDGVALVRALLPEKYEITVLAAGHAREARELDLADAAQVISLTFSLPPGGIVHGKVTDEDQRPLVGVDVGYRSAGTSAGYFGESPKSDAQGRYRNPHLSLKTPIEVSFRMPDYLSVTKVVMLTEPHQEHALDIVLKRRPRGGSVAGIVTDRQGKPLSGAIVGNYGNGSNDKRETTTDAQGRFLLLDMVKGYAGHEILVRARGFAPELRKVEPGPEEAPSEASVRLEPGHFLHGRVETAAGVPLQGAYVSLSNGRLPHQVLEFGRTDEQGRFEYDSLAADARFRVSLDGYSARDDVLLPLDGDGIVSVKLEPMGVLRGRVLDAATGQAIKDFKVRLGFSGDRRAGDVRGTFAAGLGDPGRRFQAADGTFTLNELTSQMALEITVEAEGYQRSVLPRVVVPSVTEVRTLDIPLNKAIPSKPAGLTGTVIDHRQNPIAGVQLRLIVSTSASTGEDDHRFNWVLIDSGQLGRQSDVAQYLSTVSDERGRFEFRDVLPAMYLQLAYWGPDAPKNRSLAFAKTKSGVTRSVTIEVPEPATIRGSFNPKSFPDLGEVQLTHKTDVFHTYRSELTAGQAEFRFENLPPGDYWLSLMHQPERSKDDPRMYSLRPLAARSLTVEPGGAYQVQFTEADRVDQQGR